eukprot:XP_011662539.1 PREDICTED: uncharacterized protein LOC105437540 [Strongylocentrotus purpuratus]
MGDSGEESEDDKSRQDDPDPKGCPHTTSNIRSSGNSSDIKNLLNSCDRLLTQGDSCTPDFLSSRHSDIRELLTPRDSYTIEPLTQGDFNIQELFTPRDSHTNELLTPTDSNANEVIALGDSYIQELLMPRDSHTNELLTPTDYYANKLLTPGHSFTNTSLSHGDSYIHKLLAPRDSYTNKSLKPGDFCTQDFLSPTYFDTRELLTPRNSYTIDPLTQGDSYIYELLAQRDSYTNESLTPGDSCTQDFLSPTDSDTRELLTPRNSYTIEPLTQGDSYIQELLTPRDSYTNELLTPGHSNTNKSLTGVIGLESPRQEDNKSSPTSSLHRDAVPHGPSGGKEMASTSPRSSCHKTDSLKGTVDVMLSQQPYLTELLLVKAGDVELNPGPLHGSIDSVLQDSELVLLAKEVPGNCYDNLCIGLGFSLAQSRNVLTQHHLNFPGALIEFFSGWKVKQRDGTNCRALLGEILKNADMGVLQTKLLEGEYLTSGTSPSEINGVLPKRLLVEGEGGVGKTTFCSKIAWDWVNGSPEFQCFSWVLVIPLRNVVKVRNEKQYAN